MYGLSRHVSLLMSQGHPEAGWYPLGLLWVESQLVVERLNQQEATRATLLQLAVGSILSKKTGAEFKKTLKELTKNG